MDYTPPYGDLTQLNTCRDLMDAVGKELLTKIVKGYLDLLGTSAAAYEVNGDYATALFSSEWCQFLDSASRRLCGTEDNAEALASGRRHCHESCWTQASRVSIETGKPFDLRPCLAGINIYAVPIISEGTVIGSLNFGYGTPPQDEKTLREIAERYHVDIEELRRVAEAYEPRPDYIIETAKRQVEVAGELVAGIYGRKRAEEEVQRHLERLEALREIDRAIMRESDLGKVLGLVVDSARKLTGARVVEIALVDPAKQEALMAVRSGLKRGECRVKEESSSGKGVDWRIVEKGITVRVEDVTKEPDSIGVPEGHPLLRGLLGVPIKDTQGQGIALFLLTDKEGGGHFTPEDQEMVETFAAQAAVAIENARLY